MHQENQTYNKLHIVCPKCGYEAQRELLTWEESVAAPFFCPICSEISWIVDQDNTESYRVIATPFYTPSKDIPPLKVGTSVYINNSDHEFFLERGLIVDKDHVHYRIGFSSLDKRINGKKMWFPADWIMEVPKELL